MYVSFLSIWVDSSSVQQNFNISSLWLLYILFVAFVKILLELSSVLDSVFKFYQLHCALCMCVFLIQYYYYYYHFSPKLPNSEYLAVLDRFKFIFIMWNLSCVHQPRQKTTDSRFITQLQGQALIHYITSHTHMYTDTHIFMGHRHICVAWQWQYNTSD